ncbi:hypothetical protein EDD27_0732 [Nonomuraea polychroma]|uniref:Uncharacterized protein n=1 Tax=Nonomuraea polychroma TaxID=46176 RepID=A0A438LY03_9ACTN|nr:hypothetical protein [Nonomuraea polychroma]RVX38424.1 hypothetical protein EDD27_0732 [Nonomuraea polychroma]
MTTRPLVVGAFSPSVLLRTARRLGLLAPDVREVAVASSPAQFAALLDGEIDAALTSLDNVIAYRHVPANPPYLGTVLCALGANPAVRRLATALRETTRAILGGAADDVVIEEAAAALRTSPATARAPARCLQCLKDPDDGLVADGRADLASLSTIVVLRRRYGSAPDGDLLTQGLLDLGEDSGR